MIDFKTAIRTTVLLVDDDVHQLGFCALALEMSGFSVVTASGPIEAIAILKEPTFHRFDIAIIDYRMPVMNGCVLAEYLKERHPELKTVLYSDALSIPKEEMSAIDLFVAKADGVASLLARIAESGPLDVANPVFLSGENSYYALAVN